MENAFREIRPALANEADRERWRACRREAERRHQHHLDLEARRDESTVNRVLDHAKQLRAEGRKVPPGDLGNRLSYLCAAVDLDVHVAVDSRARQAFEHALLSWEAGDPDVRDASWWHALDGHSFSLDDPEARCSCGRTVGRITRLIDLIRLARELWDSGWPPAPERERAPAPAPAAPKPTWWHA